MCRVDLHGEPPFYSADSTPEFRKRLGALRTDDSCTSNDFRSGPSRPPITGLARAAGPASAGRRRHAAMPPGRAVKWRMQAVRRRPGRSPRRTRAPARTPDRWSRRLAAGLTPQEAPQEGIVRVVRGMSRTRESPSDFQLHAKTGALAAHDVVIVSAAATLSRPVIAAPAERCE